ncbi:hypothetical protein ACQKNX_07505 [Lysinibacillus sp. NPDC093712]|uniref:hypothetical protein n=1 Tax=Lysinibacillus sp. NPDC093712 TaxID=3390579 RepID=UPI003D005A57
MNYKEKLKLGLCLPEDIEEEIDTWHTDYEGDLSLIEYLGLTFDEYALYVENEKLYYEQLSVK